MGLLSKINSLQNKNAMGLLARAQQIGNKKFSFATWATNHGLKHAAVFAPINNFYYISESLNIDARTIALSVSSKDFWDGSLDFQKTQFQPYTKNNGTLGRFYQFFREDLRQDVDELYFLPFTKDSQTYILMILKKNNELLNLPETDASFIASLTSTADTISSQTEEKLSELIESSIGEYQANMFIFSYKLSLEVLFKGIEISHPEIKEKVIDSMSKSLFAILEKLFAKPNCVVMGSSSEIKLILFTHEDEDENLILTHIKSTLEFFLGKECASSLLLLNAGATKNGKGALAFLIKG